MKYLLLTFSLILFSIIKNVSQTTENNEVDSLSLILESDSTYESKIRIAVQLTHNKLIENEAKAYQMAEIIVATLKDNNDTLSVNTLAYFSRIIGNFSDPNVFQQFVELLPKLTSNKNLLFLEAARLSYKYTLTGEYDKATKYINLSLSLEDIITNKKVHAEVLMYAGFIFRNIEDGTQNEDYSKAMQYFRKAQETDSTNEYSYAVVTREIGNLYLHLNKLDSALFYQTKAIEIIKKQKSEQMSNFYNDISGTYERLGQYDKQIEYLRKSANCDMQTGNKWGLTVSYMNLATSFFSIKQYDSTEFYINKAVELVDLLNTKPLKLNVYEKKVLIEQYLGNIHEAYNYLSYAYFLKDSIMNEDKNKQMAMMNVRFETAKKDKELLQNKEEIKQQRIIIVSALGFGLLLLVFFVSVFFLYRKIRAANYKLTLHNIQIIQQKEEIEAQRDEIEAQRNHIQKQHDTVVAQKQHITDSINYAQRIQQAVLPLSQNIEKIIPEHFVLFKPRDIVSGDFYFVKEINEYIIIAAADCTGHGVPGAFMSMLGITFLSEISRRSEVQTAAQTLEILRADIKQALNQQGSALETKDGMDISLVVINRKINEMQYAGAYNSLYIVRNKKLNLTFDNSIKTKTHESNDNILYEIKADRQPIAIHLQEKPFTNNTFSYDSNDRFYLFSDGFADQIGGTEGKKFMSHNFKELLLNIQNQNIKQQKQTITETLDKWKQNKEQVDDILVLGFTLTK